MENLKDQLRARRDSMSSDHATRLHRSISWLKCADIYAKGGVSILIVIFVFCRNCCLNCNFCLRPEADAYDFKI